MPTATIDDAGRAGGWKPRAPCTADMRADVRPPRRLGWGGRPGAAALALAATLLLGSCAVGPKYERPAPPHVDRYTAAPHPARIPAAPDAGGAAGAAQTLEPGAAVNAAWWRAFGSTALDALVGRALEHNPDLAAAKATVEQARQQLRATRGAFFPQVSLALGAERTRSSGAASGGLTGPQLYDLYTGQIQVGYAPGVFGLNRMVMRDAQAQVDVAREQLRAVHLALAGNVVTTVIDLASLDAQIAAMRGTVDDQRQLLDLTRTRYRLGAVANFDVLTQGSLLASSEAQLIQLQQARDAAAHLLATYLGTFPADSGTLATPALATLSLPRQLPLTVPSGLVRARPDIRAAEAQLRAANAEVGIAAARMYPNLEISAAYGAQSNHTGDFFDPASELWNVVAGLVQPLFQGGTLLAQKRAAEAAYQAMLASYQGTVLAAFRNVADVLRALQHDSAYLDAQARAMRDAQAALALVRTQYQSGGVDYLTLLTSETQFRNAEIAYAQAEAQRYSDTAALYVALGGGNGSRAAVADARGRPAPRHTARADN